MEHAYAGVCGFPATRWNYELNICEIDDSGQEPDRTTSKQLEPAVTT